MDAAATATVTAATGKKKTTGVGKKHSLSQRKRERGGFPSRSLAFRFFYTVGSKRAYSLITRRRFLNRSAWAAAGVCAAGRALPQSMHGPAMRMPARTPNLDPDTLARWVDALPMPQIARPVERRAAPDGSGKKVPFYRVPMRAAAAKVHRDLAPTNFWSYGGIVPGLQFETRSGEGLLVEWANELPKMHFLPVAHTRHGAEKDVPEVRGVVHMHGG